MDWSTVGSCPKEQSVHLKTRRQLLTLNEVSGFSLTQSSRLQLHFLYANM